MKKTLVTLAVIAVVMTVNYAIWRWVVVPVFDAPPLTYWQVWLLWGLLRSVVTQPTVKLDK